MDLIFGFDALSQADIIIPVGLLSCILSMHVKQNSKKSICAGGAMIYAIRS